MLFLAALNGYGQDYRINERTRFYTVEMPGDSLFLKADNSFSISLSMKVDFDLENLEGVARHHVLAILPGKSFGVIVARFKKSMPGEDYKCVYHWKIVLGDISKIPDAGHVYAYPYQIPRTYPVTQGPGGRFSHKNSFAYDFAMPIGSRVTAARDGIVAFVDTRSDIGGPYPELIDKANIISVLHADGTIANYVHLRKNGAVVQEGQIVKKGDLIGYSGNTGFSNGPHLHFEVVQPSLDLETKKWVSFRWEHSGYSVANLHKGFRSFSEQKYPDK